MNSNKKKLFEYYLNFLSFNLRQYETYKFYEQNRNIFYSKPHIYPVFSSTFLRGHILGLAILLDQRKTRGNKNFSARLFDLEKKLEDPNIKNITKKITDLRRKWLAHQDFTFVLNPNKIEEIDLKKEIEEIKLFETLSQIAKTYATKKLKIPYFIDERFIKTKDETRAFLNQLHVERTTFI